MNILKDSVMEFHLEQITPMIHFQGEEDGAGIRASDLKPRFDVFFKKYWYDSETEEKRNAIETYILKQNESEKQQDGENEKIAFDYKVKIINEKKDDNITFYKNMKANRPTFHGSFYGKLQDGKNSFYKDVTVVFISRHEELREKIKDLFPVFLAVNSFGLRNNKGYGYFKIKDKKETEIIKDIKKYQDLVNSYRNRIKGEGIGIYQLEIKNNSLNNCVGEVLDDIKLFHQILKSGLNVKNRYVSSLMLKKMEKREGITLEKKALKLFLKERKYNISALTGKGDVKVTDNYKDLDKKKIYYVRGLLGLAPFYEFKNIKKDEDSKLDVRFTLEQDDIERFASPIRYLPFSHKSVILLVDYGKIADFRKKVTRVDFSLEEVMGKKINKTNSKVQAMIPTEEQYSIHQLFEKTGVIAKNIGKDKKFNYSVISDI